MAKKAAKQSNKEVTKLTHTFASDFLSKPKKILKVTPAFDMALGGGIPQGSWVILTGKYKTGKEQPLSSLVYTPNGPVKMGDIKVGSIVCTPDGETANVTNVFPQGVKDVYEITFSDNSTVRCGLEHLWKARQNDCKFHYQIITLKEILKQGYSKNKWLIELTKPVYFNEQNLPIDPYILGSSVKDFIPTIYKYSSISDRFKLINGLMDTDGYNDNGSTAEYTTVSKILAQDVVELLQSVGFLAKIKQRITKCNNKEFISYRIHISGNHIDSLFSLPRKIFNRKRIKPPLHKSIKKIELVGQEECQCIEIDHPNHLYITDGYTVTHNTSTAMHMVAQFLNQFEDSNALYVDVENRLKEQTLSNIHLPKDRLQLLHSTQDHIYNAEDTLDATEAWIKNNPESIIVLDSTSALCSQKEYVDNFSGSTRSLGPKLMAAFTRKLAPIIPVQNSIIILITHLIANTSGYGSPFMEDSGNKIQYQSDIKLRCRKNEEWTLNDRLVGQKNEWSVEWSAMGPPGQSVTSYLKYNEGLDEVMEITDMAVQFGIIFKGGAWFTYKEHKMQGINSVYEYLKENPTILAEIHKEIVELST